MAIIDALTLLKVKLKLGIILRNTRNAEDIKAHNPDVQLKAALQHCQKGFQILN